MEVSSESLVIRDQLEKEILPAQYTQNQVEDKKGPKDDKTDEVDPRQLKAHCIIHLKRDMGREAGKRNSHIRSALFIFLSCAHILMLTLSVFYNPTSRLM